jgi:hypothetical protein
MRLLTSPGARSVADPLRGPSPASPTPKAIFSGGFNPPDFLVVESKSYCLTCQRLRSDNRPVETFAEVPVACDDPKNLGLSERTIKHEPLQLPNRGRLSAFGGVYR